MGNTPLDKHSITFQKLRIAIGSSVAAFFFKQGTSDVILDFNYKNNSMTIEAMTLEKKQSYPYEIINGLSISSTQPFIKTFNNPRWVFYIEVTAHNNIIDMSKRYLTFKVKPIAKDKLLVENIPIIPIFYTEKKRMIVDLNNGKIICQSGKFIKNATPRSHSVSNSSRWVAKLSQNKTNMNQNQTKVVTPTIAPRQNDIVNKESGNIWGFEKPVGNLPSPEQRLDADKTYSKMILGE